MKKLLAIVLVLMVPATSLGWSKTGHHIIAIMAYDLLDEAEQQEFLRLLKAHPRFEEDFSASTEEHYLVGRAGYWPDVARRFPEWTRPTWHYQLGAADVLGEVADVPPYHTTTVPPGTTLKTQELYAGQAIEFCKTVLKDKSRPDSDRALAICWLCHLVADSHQPCHAGSLYVEDVFPDGDRGANSIRIKQGRNMHSLWDGRLGRGYDPGDIRRRIHGRSLRRTASSK